MKVEKLIEILNDIPLDFEVVVSKDSEGNGFSPLSSLETRMYEADSTYSGSLIDKEGNEETYKENVVVLWPTN